MYYIAIQKREHGDHQILKKDKYFLFNSIEETVEFLLEDKIYYLSSFCSKDYEKIQKVLDKYDFFKIEEIKNIKINDYPIIKKHIVMQIENYIKKDKKEYKEELKKTIEECQKELERIDNEEY